MGKFACAPSVCHCPTTAFLCDDVGSKTGLDRAPLLRILPILGVLFAASDNGLTLVDLFARLPKRFSRAALLENFPRSLGLKIVAFLSAHATDQKLLAKFFAPEMGFGTIVHVDCTDGVRILFDNGDVAHVRPSGNADDLRIYAVAGTQIRADAIAAMGVAEPNGILRRLQLAVAVNA